MKRSKRFFLTLGILFALLFLFKGTIYRYCITYHIAGERRNYTVTDTRLQKLIDSQLLQKNTPSVQDIIQQSLHITTQQLRFSTTSQPSDPNTLIYSQNANCIGYAAFFSAVCNQFLNKYQLTNWEAQPLIGKLYLFHTNIHPYFHSSFFKDHDFVLIRNKKTDECYAVDPTLYDYLHIEQVKYTK